MSRLFCFGLGYCANVLARRLMARGWQVAGTTTHAEKAAALARDGYDMFLFDGQARNDAAARALEHATHVLLSIPPDGDGDPALRHYRDVMTSSAPLAWIGYLSSVGVYGDAQGAWVDETTPPQPGTERGQRRLKAENDWLDFGRACGKALVIFRLPGIYGPGRSAIDQLLAGKARRVFKPGQVTNRVHVEDIASAVEAALPLKAGTYVFNVTDDLPAPPQDVIAYGADLLGVPCPPATDPADESLSPMARSFYGESKRVSNARMKAELGVRLAYPTYVEGLKAITRSYGVGLSSEATPVPPFRPKDG
jgi:nucleoside-diphosphate-sugar epimerase